MQTCPGCGAVHDHPSGDDGVEQLHSLGPDSIAWLKQAGINTVAELTTLGAVVAYLRVEALDVKPGVNLLYALEAAIKGTHWLEIKRQRGTELLMSMHAARELVAT